MKKYLIKISSIALSPIATVVFVLVWLPSVAGLTEEEQVAVLSLLTILTIAHTFSFGENAKLLVSAVRGTVRKNETTRVAFLGAVSGYITFLLFGGAPNAIELFLVITLTGMAQAQRTMYEAAGKFFVAALYKTGSVLCSVILVAYVWAGQLSLAVLWVYIVAVLGIVVIEANKTPSTTKMEASKKTSGKPFWRLNFLPFSLHATLFLQGDRVLAQWFLSAADFISFVGIYELVGKFSLGTAILLGPIIPQLASEKGRSRGVIHLKRILGAWVLLNLTVGFLTYVFATNFLHDFLSVNVADWEVLALAAIIGIAVALQKIFMTESLDKGAPSLYLAIELISMTTSIFLIHGGVRAVVVLFARALIAISLSLLWIFRNRVVNTRS